VTGIVYFAADGGLPDDWPRDWVDAGYIEDGVSEYAAGIQASPELLTYFPGPLVVYARCVSARSWYGLTGRVHPKIRAMHAAYRHRQLARRRRRHR
jgi:hypothetical protein